MVLMYCYKYGQCDLYRLNMATHHIDETLRGRGTVVRLNKRPLAVGAVYICHLVATLLITITTDSLLAVSDGEEDDVES